MSMEWRGGVWLCLCHFLYSHIYYSLLFHVWPFISAWHAFLPPAAVIACAFLICRFLILDKCVVRGLPHFDGAFLCGVTTVLVLCMFLCSFLRVSHAALAWRGHFRGWGNDHCPVLWRHNVAETLLCLCVCVFVCFWEWCVVLASHPLISLIHSIVMLSLFMCTWHTFPLSCPKPHILCIAVQPSLMSLCGRLFGGWLVRSCAPQAHASGSHWQLYYYQPIVAFL